MASHPRPPAPRRRSAVRVRGTADRDVPVVLVALGDEAHFQREILIGIGAAAQPLGWGLRPAAWMLGDPAAARRPLHGVSGIIAYCRTPQQHRAVASHGLPLVELGDGDADLGIDEDAVGTQAVAHLAAAGYRRIAMLRGHDQEQGLRWLGVRAASRRLGMPVVDFGVDLARHDEAAIGGWLARQARDGALGVVCHNDLMAWQAASACRSAGLALPGRIGLLGCDDDPLVAALSPLPLSSVAMPHRRMGGEAVRLLAGLMGGERRPAPALLPPSGVAARASTSAVAVEDPLVAAACAWIASHAASPLGIDAIADAIGAGRRQLERRFRSALGRSPLDQVHLARLGIAQQGLQAGASVAQAAGDAGWSVDALTAACRTWLGTTPAELMPRR